MRKYFLVFFIFVGLSISYADENPCADEAKDCTEGAKANAASGLTGEELRQAQNRICAPYIRCMTRVTNKVKKEMDGCP